MPRELFSSFKLDPVFFWFCPTLFPKMMKNQAFICWGKKTIQLHLPKKSPLKLRNKTKFCFVETQKTGFAQLPSSRRVFGMVFVFSLKLSGNKKTEEKLNRKKKCQRKEAFWFFLFLTEKHKAHLLNFVLVYLSWQLFKWRILKFFFCWNCLTKMSLKENSLKK